VPEQKSALAPGLRVLLVEDEPLIAIDGQAMLLAMGVARVVCTRGVAITLDALQRETFDAAILDLRLDQDSSIPLARRLDDLGVPFGFLTGYQGDAIPEEFKDRPIVAKPFNAEQLQQLVRTLISAQ
jgi:DNA-binding response OmpR family regulator